MEEVCPSSTNEEKRIQLRFTASPPPNCAICLSDCDNKSFTDQCMHQFCFDCLLKWSKVKAECPLCKQPFKSIIHNVKSVSEYEEHIILTPSANDEHDNIAVDVEEHLYYLPSVAPPPRPRRFQFRTTLVLDQRDELAIQEMLMSHPLTNSLYMPSLRTAIYQHNWWVNDTVDVTGRYRDCSPQFFRENPAQLHRITPWLHRELTALLNHNIPHMMYVTTVILNLLNEHHVTSPEFRSRIHSYFGDRTDHFIHEFHSFLRSPYDMIGYGRYSTYTQRNIEINSSNSSSDSDSDVQVISTRRDSDCVIVGQTPAQRRETTDVIVLSDTDSNNSDVIIREPTPPPIIDIADSDDNELEPSMNNQDVLVPEVKSESIDSNYACFNNSSDQYVNSSSNNNNNSECCDNASSGSSSYSKRLHYMKRKKAAATSDSENSYESWYRIKKEQSSSEASSSTGSKSSIDTYSSDEKYVPLARKRIKRIRRNDCPAKRKRRYDPKRSEDSSDTNSDVDKPSTSKYRKYSKRLRSVVVKPSSSSATQNRTWYERPEQPRSSDESSN